MSLLPYRDYSSWLRETYGEKVYKIPVKLPLTCPNRDGTCGTGGCIFCGEEGGSFENLDSRLSVKEQCRRNKDYIGKKYGVKKFIPYFQNFTNTYLPIDDFGKALEDCIGEDVVGITISTRPDFLGSQYLECASYYRDSYTVTFELGLQTVNYRTLRRINRGHGLAEFIDGVLKLKARNLRVCTHMILDLPWDTIEDVVEGAKILNVLGVDEVKLHSLYIIEGSSLGKSYREGKVKPLSFLEYKERVLAFLEHLDPEIIVGRLVGRAPKDISLFCNWGMSWWKIRDSIVQEMEESGRRQGSLFKTYNS